MCWVDTTLRIEKEIRGRREEAENWNGMEILTTRVVGRQILLRYRSHVKCGCRQTSC